MKQTWSKLRAHVVHVYYEYVYFMFGSSCKRGISDLLCSAVFRQADPQRYAAYYFLSFDFAFIAYAM